MIKFFRVSLKQNFIIYANRKYNSTRGSLLVVILFHALFDFLSVSRAGGSNAAAIMSAGVMIWAVLVVILFKPANLSHEQKQTA